MPLKLLSTSNPSRITKVTFEFRFQSSVPFIFQVDFILVRLPDSILEVGFVLILFLVPQLRAFSSTYEILLLQLMTFERRCCRVVAAPVVCWVGVQKFLMPRIICKNNLVFQKNKNTVDYQPAINSLILR